MVNKYGNKHAFLIMAHTQPLLLKRLLRRLDHERIDIFLHLDKKSIFDETELKKTVKHSSLFLTQRLNITWGGYSIIQAELELLEKATNTNKYGYYHLLSGQDYLLESIDKILSFYDHTPNVNYISFKYDEVSNYIDRLKLRYPFQEIIGHGRMHIALYCFQYFLKIIQKVLKLYRKIPETVGYGSQFFDITDDFARWIVKEQDYWKPIYKNTVCADEMFVQTLYLLYSKVETTKLCYQVDKNYKTFDRAGITIKRAIDWTRGKPYVWVKDDYEILKSSSLLFVRKVDETKSKDLLDILDKIV